MSDNVLIALIGAAAGILGAFKLPDIIKDFRDTLEMKNNKLVSRVNLQKEIIENQKKLIEKYDQLKYKIPLIVDIIKLKNPNDLDIAKLLDMLQTDYTKAKDSISIDKNNINDMLQ